MPVDMKEAIAAAARTLVMDKHVKKLTVKDIVEECGITRQAFYYHFADIPELLQWVLERETAQILQRSRQQGGGGRAGAAAVLPAGGPGKALHPPRHADRLPRRAGTDDSPTRSTAALPRWWSARTCTAVTAAPRCG